MVGLEDSTHPTQARNTAMKKVWLMLAVLLTVNGAVCRADDPKPAEIARKAAADVKKYDGKDYVEAVDAKDAAGCGSAANHSGFTCAAPANCRIGRGADCWKKLWGWLTYCPLQRSCLCDCCHKCNDCAPPPLYTYFLDPYHACASGNGCTTYDKSECAGCARR
jgi:hypothetical protein